MKWVAPELATLTHDYFSDPGWIFEEKFDGMRCIAVKKKGKVTLFSRHQKTLNRSFPELVSALEKLPKGDFIVDGEIIAFEGKITSFSKLQLRLGVSAPTKALPTVYLYLFDLISWEGKDLRKLPLIERKKILKREFPFKNPIRYTPHLKEKGIAFFKKACKKGLEGIMAKRADSIYQSKRTRDWMKFKCSSDQELVIGGYTKPQGSRIGFGALLLGYYKKGKFAYAGKVGTGFNQAMLKKLFLKLKSIKRKSSPFDQEIKEKNITFVEPKLVCEVGFTEWTKEGKLRHPRFLGLRKDKVAKEVSKES